MKKPFLLIASIAAAAVVSLVYAKVVNTQKADSLFYENVEALAEYELCPGEEENCETSSSHCYYYYGGKNYNIERASNKSR